jgi:hypothetical protein
MGQIGGLQAHFPTPMLPWGSGFARGEARPRERRVVVRRRVTFMVAGWVGWYGWRF